MKGRTAKQTPGSCSSEGGMVGGFATKGASGDGKRNLLRIRASKAGGGQ